MRPSQNLPPSQNIPPFQQIHMCDPPRIYPSLLEYTHIFNNYFILPESTPSSQNLPPFLTNLYVRPSQNLPLPPRIYPLINNYATLPESTPSSQNIPPFSTNSYVRPSQNLPFPPGKYPHFQQLFYYATLSESTRPPPLPVSTPFSTTVCDPYRIYPSAPPPPEYTPIFNKFICVTLSESTTPSKIYPHFQQLFCHATLPESIPPFQNIPPFNNCMRHSQKLPFPQRIQLSFLTTICPPPYQNVSLVPFLHYISKIYPSVTEYAHFSRNYM